MVDRLQRTSTGFVLFRETGEQLRFDAGYARPGENVLRYFLSEIVQPGGAATKLVYKQPADPRCPAGDSSGMSGVPYLQNAITPEAQLSLAYKTLTDAADSTACVISEVWLESERELSSAPAVRYTYASEGAVERPGRIASASWPNRNEQYDYSGGGFVRTSSAGDLATHQHDSARQVVSVVTSREGLEVDEVASYLTCPANTSCMSPLQTRKVRDIVAGRGDGAAGAAGLTLTYQMTSNVGQTLGNRLNKIEESCTVQNTCSPGTKQVVWADSKVGMPGHEVARKDKRNSWEAYQYETLDAGGARTAPVRTALFKGATDMTGSGSLEQKYFTYEVDANGLPRLNGEEQPSVLGPSGARARSSKRSDASGRITATFRSGWTMARDSGGTWSTRPRVK